jgi:DinB superfamily
MNKAFDIILKPRIGLVKLLESLTIEQLNDVPAGFNNNIIWNAGHLIATQQGICYKRSGLDLRIDEAFFQTYKPESRPEKSIGKDEVENISRLLVFTMEQLETDYNNKLFTNYTPWTTRYGVELSNIDQALNFLPFHEGLHFGTIGAMKRLVAK